MYVIVVGNKHLDRNFMKFGTQALGTVLKSWLSRNGQNRCESWLQTV